MARPTIYNKTVLIKAKHYLDNYKDSGHPFPSVVGLSRVLKIAHSAIKRWTNDEDKQEFKATLEQIKDEQHLQLINNGIVGLYNAPITKLMLHNFGYSEKQKEQSNEKLEIIVTREKEPKEMSMAELDEMIANG